MLMLDIQIEKKKRLDGEVRNWFDLFKDICLGILLIILVAWIYSIAQTVVNPSNLP